MLRHELRYKTVFDSQASPLELCRNCHACWHPLWERDAEWESVLAGKWSFRKLVDWESDVEDRSETAMVSMVGFMPRFTTSSYRFCMPLAHEGTLVAFERERQHAGLEHRLLDHDMDIASKDLSCVGGEHIVFKLNVHLTASIRTIVC